jgi:CheY-like chemotaxis protein
MPTKTKVLIVDDEKDLTNALELFLGDAGYAVHVANDGQKAKELISEFRYDLVLLDLNMPGIDGISVAGILKQKWPSLPIIVITGFKGEYEDKLKKLNIHEHVMDKPLGLLDLAKKMKQILGPIHHADSPKAVTDGVPKAKLLFIEHHDALYVNLFSPYFNEMNKSKKAAYELVFSEDNANASTLIRIYQPDIILLNTDAMGIYPDLKKELQSTLAVPKEIIVHGRDLRYKKAGDLGFDPQQVTAIEGGNYDMNYPKVLEDAVREIAYRCGLIERPNPFNPD